MVITLKTIQITITTITIIITMVIIKKIETNKGNPSFFKTMGIV